MKKTSSISQTCWLVVLFVAALLLPGQLAADSITLYPTDDAYMYESGPGGNGSLNRLKIGYSTTYQDYRSVLKFDLSQIPAGSTINSAQLKVHYCEYYGSSDTRNVRVYRVTSNWSESTVSWNNNYYGYYDEVSAGGGYTSWFTWDVRLLVEYWIGGTYSNYGMMLKCYPEGDTTDNVLYFESTENGSYQPYLTVDYTPPQTGDIYEPDNNSGQANSMPHNTCSMVRSINPATDQDWIYFDLAATSEVTVMTYGPSGDTRMWLYNSSLTEIEFNDDGGDGLFSKIERLGGDALPAGRYYVKVDEYGNNDIISTYYLDLAVDEVAQEPDLVPYQPSGWADKIVISDISGTNSDGTIYSGQTSYIDYSVLNDGNADAVGGFYVEIWDDTTGERIRRGYRSSTLSAGYYYEQEDSTWTFTQTGWHTIRVIVDADSAIGESDESNNEYSRQVYVNAPPTNPDLEPYQPSGWGDKIIVSDTTGTNTDTTLYTNQASYIDYAVVNNGDGDAAGGFYVEIWDDTTGQQIRRGHQSSTLQAGYYYEQEDSSWTFTQSGWHTIRVKVDADNTIGESDEGNNEYSRQIYITESLIAENEIPGASNNPSSVPTYLNNPGMYDIGSAGSGGICFATSMTDILGYWDRNAYSNGITYWNLINHGKAPLLQPQLPQNPGHDEADVGSMVIAIATRYYINSEDQDDIVEAECNNSENDLSFNATFRSAVTSSAEKQNYFDMIKDEIDAGRPIKAASLGTFFGGAHAIPVIGYKEFHNAESNEVYIHENTGDDDSMYVNFFDPTWGGLNLVEIVPGGTPNDHYEDLDGQDDDERGHGKWIFPDDVYEFRQTHNFKSGFLGIGDDSEDWIRFTAIAGRKYTIETRNLGANSDTYLQLDWDGGTFCLVDDDSGSEPLASKIVWDCAQNTTAYILVTDVNGSTGHDTNYDIEVTYETIVLPQTPTPVSPSDNATLSTLTPQFSWSSFQDGGNGATQNGYQVRVRCDSDGDTIVYDTGYISSTSASSHTYNPGAYSSLDPISGDTRVSAALERDKYYHWHVRYRDSNGRWSGWSADIIGQHQDFYIRNLTPGNLYMSDTSSFTSTGFSGGPFSPPSKQYTLQNNGETSISWSALSSMPWLSLSSSSGTLNPGESVSVTISVNSNANGLSADTYYTFVNFVNNSNHNGDTMIPVTLTVQQPGTLTVSPADAINSSGVEGGPFSPGGRSYTLSNTGESSINWNASWSQNWLTVTPATGSLPAGQSTNVTVAINTEADNLSAGTYQDSVSLTNTTNGQGNTSRSVTLTVQEVAVPTISELSPDSGAVGTAVTISGSSFGGATGSITFNGTTAPVTSWSDTQIQTEVPQGATTGSVVVKTSGGVNSNGVVFTVLTEVDRDSVASEIIQTADGGFALIGYTNASTAGGDDFLVIKLDGDGVIQWYKKLGGGYDDRGTSIAQTADGGFVVAGYTYSFVHGAAGVDSDFLLYKLSSTGKKQARVNLGGVNPDEAYSVSATAEGGFIVAGKSYSYTNGGSDNMVYKLDSKGIVLWQKNLGGTGDDELRVVREIPTGGYVIAGSTTSFTNGGSDYLGYKLSVDGVKKGRANFGGTGSDILTSLEQTADAGFVMMGYSNSFTNGGYDFLIYRLAKNGDIVWQKNLGGSNDDIGNCIHPTPDNGFIAGGSTESYTNGGSDFLVYKIDSNGNTEWQKNIGGLDDDLSNCVIRTAAGNYIVAGSSYSSPHETFRQNIMIVKLDANSNTVWQKILEH